MSDEPRNGWTFDTIKILLDGEIRRVEELLGEKISAQERAVTLLGNANQIAQDKFEATVKESFAKQNEFRSSLDDLGKQMATRRELEAGQIALGGRLDDLSKQIADLRSRLDVGPAGLSALQSRVDVAGGRDAGIQLSVGWFFSGLAAFATIIGILVFVANHHP